MLNVLKINADLFTCDMPLVMIFDEFSRLSGMSDDLFVYEVKIPEPDHARSVEQQYDDLKNSDLEIYEPRKCYGDNYMTMDWYMKNALWIYWKRGNDEEMLTGDEVFNLEEKNKENEIAKIFRIETDLFQFNVPLCKAFKDFNSLLQIDVDILNGTINDDTIQANQELFDERELKGDNDEDIKDLDDCLVRDDAPFIANKEEE
nr:hypothetical protein [Tanacetum cinerariifolium]